MKQGTRDPPIIVKSDRPHVEHDGLAPGKAMGAAYRDQSAWEWATTELIMSFLISWLKLRQD